MDDNPIVPHDEQCATRPLSWCLWHLDERYPPIVTHTEFTQVFSRRELQWLLDKGILEAAPHASTIARPARFGPGPDLVVGRASNGEFFVCLSAPDGTAGEHKVPADWVVQYGISATALGEYVREKNGIGGVVRGIGDGLFRLGCKTVRGYGDFDFYFGVPRRDYDAFFHRCAEIKACANAVGVFVLLPKMLPSIHLCRRLLCEENRIYVSMHKYAKENDLVADWAEICREVAFEPIKGYSKDDKIFALRGATWRVVYNGIARDVRGSIGMEYLSILLSSPGTDIYATRLIAEVRGGAMEVARGEEMIDDRGLKGLKNRLGEVEAEIEKARDENDKGRIEALEEEKAAILSEVERTVGLGGRKRKKGDPAEKARQSVTRATRRAIDMIDECHKAAGAHFRESVKTGVCLCYRPQEAVQWEVRDYGKGLRDRREGEEACGGA